MPAINSKRAVDIAITYANQIFDQPPGLSVEELELSPDGWLVTVGYWREPPPSPNRLASITSTPSRVMKTLTIDSNTGDILAMKIRETKPFSV